MEATGAAKRPYSVKAPGACYRGGQAVSKSADDVGAQKAWHWIGRRAGGDDARVVDAGEVLNKEIWEACVHGLGGSKAAVDEGAV